MLTAQPSIYDMFALIELYGRKLQSVYVKQLLVFINNTDNSKIISWVNIDISLQNGST